MMGSHLTFLLFAVGVNPKLTPDYYKDICPDFQKIIRETITNKQISHPTIAAGTLHLFMLDCFVEGCDSSVSLPPTHSTLPRRMSTSTSPWLNYTTDRTMAVFDNVMAPEKFDNMYYKNLARGLGLLSIDQMMYADPRTRPYVIQHANNQTAFFEAFAEVMVKLGVMDVKTGRKGEVSSRCDNSN
ncbi:hypothetical protein MLD38_037573 [Melastoma candidum]|uniref:Uncharacterized protein n=1 Tax=Melastoma candidum TaxID=119954 RepID=A0ACB9LNN9_9MYRT|nr:hypothetical protein MLD38_037573 [Melastoma candidum]